MESKFNWGWKIALLYGGFVCFMLMMVFKASNQKVELVTTKYYEEELQYQSHIDKIAKTDSSHARPDWQVKGNQVAMLFPETNGKESIVGNIRFYCPSDEHRDFSVPFSAAPSSPISISNEKLRHGTYKMQIDWKQGASDFYTEGIVTIQ
ncbi:MAG: hypothetical protein JWO03_2159 [Bacteroidetes bacterium]|nr:hypothetical protein [Bacteroidota bacterium]